MARVKKNREVYFKNLIGGRPVQGRGKSLKELGRNRKMFRTPYKSCIPTQY